jgi:hypothetical protein
MAQHDKVRFRPVEEWDLGHLERGSTARALSGPFEWQGYRDPTIHRRRLRRAGDRHGQHHPGFHQGRLVHSDRVAQFRDYEDYLDHVETLVAVIKSTGEGVHLPGEVEDRRAAADGGTIALDEDMAAQPSALGRRLGVEPPARLTGGGWATRRVG